MTSIQMGCSVEVGTRPATERDSAACPQRGDHKGSAHHSVARLSFLSTERRLDFMTLPAMGQKAVIVDWTLSVVLR